MKDFFTFQTKAKNEPKLNSTKSLLKSGRYLLVSDGISIDIPSGYDDLTTDLTSPMLKL